MDQDIKDLEDLVNGNSSQEDSQEPTGKKPATTMAGSSAAATPKLKTPMQHKKN